MTVYIPHSSDKTQILQSDAATGALFTSHIVQTKRSDITSPVEDANSLHPTQFRQNKEDISHHRNKTLVYIPHSSDKTWRPLPLLRPHTQVYIPHSSDKTGRGRGRGRMCLHPTQFRQNPSAPRLNTFTTLVYIPHSSDKTLLKEHPLLLPPRLHPTQFRQNLQGCPQQNQDKSRLHPTQFRQNSCQNCRIARSVAVYIPHSSDKTSLFSTFHHRRGIVYIPHSSDKTSHLAQSRRWGKKAFTSHIVQTKLRRSLMLYDVHPLFTSHIVQTKLL